MLCSSVAVNLMNELSAPDADLYVLLITTYLVSLIWFPNRKYGYINEQVCIYSLNKASQTIQIPSQWSGGWVGSGIYGCVCVLGWGN